MSGGLQIQALATYKALRDRAQNAELFEWTSPAPVADLYHFIGFPPYMAGLATLLRAKNIPYICTVLCGGRRTLPEMWSARLRHYLNAQLPGRGEYHQAIMGAKAIITITEADVSVAHYVFGVPLSRIQVVENGVDDRFRMATPELWHERYGANPYMLCVGGIQRRKNQLFLLKTANSLELPVVLIGGVLPGEQDYAQRVDEEMRKNASYGGRWLRELSYDDPLLASAYAACRAFVLLSHHETQPLSILEAMAAKKPILLGDAGYVREYPFASLPRTSLTSMNTSRCDLQALWSQGVSTSLSEAFTWGCVAEKLYNIYASTRDSRFSMKDTL
jgi:glycosyltransferase involved in cell wall biosynthesis